MQTFLITIIRVYQRVVSSHLRCSCKFWPTCSEYSIVSIRKYGCLKGILKTIYRILRCNPFGRGGMDLP